MICAIARLLEGAGHVAVGAISPIPGCAALLARELSGEAPGGGVRVSIIHGNANNPFTSLILSFGIEIHLTNTDDVSDIDLLGGTLVYSSLRDFALSGAS